MFFFARVMFKQSKSLCWRVHVPNACVQKSLCSKEHVLCFYPIGGAERLTIFLAVKIVLVALTPSVDELLAGPTLRVVEPLLKQGVTGSAFFTKLAYYNKETVSFMIGFAQNGTGFSS